MRTLLNPLMMLSVYKKLFVDVGTQSITLTPGRYKYVLRGGGGAGGENSSNNSRYGGAGAKGDIQIGTFVVTNSTVIALTVGSGGLTYANGGNGGARGEATDAPVNAGNGGGGGMPSYIVVAANTFFANGGGGGGGAGGSDSAPSRYSDGASGGGGGGYYAYQTATETMRQISFYYKITDAWYLTEDSSGVDIGITIPAGTVLTVGQTFRGTTPGTIPIDTTVTVTAINGADVTFSGALEQTGDWPYQALQPLTVSGFLHLVTGISNIPGRKGGRGGVYASTGGLTSAAQGGLVGNTTNFPDISSGRGGRGNNNSSAWKAGGAAASGGGASGGGGGVGTGNETYSHGGGGGGGAGGSTDAGGGQAGVGTTSEGGVATDGSNYHTTPTDTVAENSLYGVSGNYGVGGTSNTNGKSGFVYIERIAWS